MSSVAGTGCRAGYKPDYYPEILSRNPRVSSVKVYDEKDIEKFRQFKEKHRFGPLMAHAPYTINMAVTVLLESMSGKAVWGKRLRFESWGIRSAL